MDSIHQVHTEGVAGSNLSVLTIHTVYFPIPCRERQLMGKNACDVLWEYRVRIVPPIGGKIIEMIGPFQVSMFLWS